MVWRVEPRGFGEFGSRLDEEFVWMTQAAMEAWTSRADLKASVLLAMQGASFVLLLTGHDMWWDGSCPSVPVWAGVVAVGLLVMATCLAGLVVIPVLGSTRRHRLQHSRHLFFFGHVRHWQPEALAARLSQLTVADKRMMMAHHLVSVSRINWRKYRMLQASVLLTLLVIALMAFMFVAGFPGVGCSGASNP